MSTDPQPRGYPVPEQQASGTLVRILLPKSAYTPWHIRVAATLVDAIPFVLILGAGWAAGEVSLACGVIRNDKPLPGFCGWAITETGHYTTTGSTLLTAAAIFSLVSYVLALAYWIWNLGYRQGKTGSSLGKSILRFKVVGERTWQPIGFGRSTMRQFAHIVDYCLCYLGYLWPLWDSQRQTLADKVMSTVCVPVDQQPPS
jgi:hypothetical protein